MSEYEPIEKGVTYGFRGLRPIKLEGTNIPDYFKFLQPMMTQGTGSDKPDEGTYNGKHLKWMKRKRDDKIVAIAEDGEVFEVII